MEYNQILETIAQAARVGETVRILYPETERYLAGWREVEPYSLSTDIGSEGEHLIYGQDRLSPGHIFNAYTVGEGNNLKFCHSFIVGKIKGAKLTYKRFEPRNNWRVEF